MLCRRCYKRLYGLSRSLPKTSTLTFAQSQPSRSAYSTAAAAVARNDGPTRDRQDAADAKPSHLRMWKDPKRALSHLEDPLKLAEHVRYLLQRGEQAKALEVVRLASKRGPCTVSWNHIINDAMGKGKAQTALSIYNEMKKRGQPPDAFTYTLTLRGLSQNAKAMPTAVERAVTIFHSMLAPNCPVPPSTIHVNAAIEVCAEARNLEALYGITARLPEKGPGAPDNRTYTIILNCLREIAFTAKQSEGNEETGDPATSPQALITQGKRVWADIVARWKAGNLEMDEYLSCAMGRLLLVGTKRNCDEVLSLMQQTSNVPRQLPAFGHPDRPTHLPRALSGEEEQGHKDVQPESEIAEIDDEHYGAEEDSLASDNLFKQLITEKAVQTYSVASQPTLYVLLEACTKTNARKAAQKYWGTLTKHFAPDADNFYSYLRLLRLNHSSALSIELLKQMAAPRDQDGYGIRPQPRMFIVAMNTCQRDIFNPSCLNNVKELLTLMPRHIDPPVLPVVQIATEILSWRKGDWKVEEILPVMDALESSCRDIKNYYSYHQGTGPVGVSNEWRQKLFRFLESYRYVLRRVMGKFKEQLDPARIELLQKQEATHTASYERWVKASNEHVATKSDRRDDSRQPIKESENPVKDKVFTKGSRQDRAVDEQSEKPKRNKVYTKGSRKDQTGDKKSKKSDKDKASTKDKRQDQVEDDNDVVVSDDIRHFFGEA